MRLAHIQSRFVVSARGFFVHRQRVGTVSPRKPPEYLGTHLLNQMTELQGANLRSRCITGCVIYLVTGLSQDSVHAPNACLYRAKVSEGVGVVPFAVESEIQ